MKRITQSLEYDNDHRYELTANLGDWHKLHPLADQGVDFEYQYMYADMTDEDCLAFCLLNPQWSHMFKDV